MTFATALHDQTNVTHTENGAVAYKTTKSYVLDFFALAGGLRMADNLGQFENLFGAAYAESKELALKALFYFRDIRGGQGERELFRKGLTYLAQRDPLVLKNMVSHVPEFGRWDDLMVVLDSNVRTEVIDVIATQLAKDNATENPSLCAKWMPSENASSKVSAALARNLMKALQLTPKQYRKMLSNLRKKINIVESLISQGKWADVEYSKVPAQAGMKYKTAFFKHDEARMSEFMKKVETGEETMKAATLFPYQIVNKVFSVYGLKISANDATFYNNAWNSLPDYFKGKQEDMLVVADVSGSMNGDPMGVSISLALYAAEHNSGEWAGKFMTFSSKPTLQVVKGKTLVDKVACISAAAWEMNTDISKVFECILNAAKVANSMVKRVVIVSDMEFDQCVHSGHDESVFNTWDRKYREAGYEMPEVVFWNVRAASTHVPTLHSRVKLVSGCSPVTFEQIASGTFPSPYEYMLSVLNTERYSVIKVEG